MLIKYFIVYQTFTQKNWCINQNHFKQSGLKSNSATFNNFGVDEIDVEFFPHINSFRGPEHVVPSTSMKFTSILGSSSSSLSLNAGRPGLFYSKKRSKR